MKLKKINKIFKMLSEKCPKCKKEIIGYTEKQVKYNLNTHIRAKHKS